MRAIRKEDSEIVNSSWGLGVMLAVLAVNISLSIWQRMWARRLQSNILLADASHTFADVLTTIVVIAGWQLSAMGYFWLDRVCAIGVSVLVFYLAYSLFKQAFPILIDRFAIDPQSISSAIKEIEGILQVDRV